MRILKQYMLLRLLLGVAGSLVLAVCVVYYRAHVAMIAARQYVFDVSQLHIGISGGHEFANIRNKYKRFAQVDPNCNDDECTAQFHFGNGLPVGIYLFSPAFIYSVLTLSHGSITSSVIGSSCYGRNGGNFFAHMWESLPGPAFEVPFKQGSILSSDKVSTITFKLTPAASPEQRSRAYAFHESFLGRFGYCNDATDMH